MTADDLLQRARAAADDLRARLLAERVEAGHWVGELSSSALSTATAIVALELAGGSPAAVADGAAWLARTQNADGGWGDTTASPSNMSTTALSWAALTRVGGSADAGERARAWLAERAGGTAPEQLSSAILRAYGKDQTFSVPILTMLALCGVLGEGRAAWRFVPQLPFELAALPRRWFGALSLPVVSYAIPALIAIGLVRHHKRPRPTPSRPLRWLTRRRVLRVLEAVQPTSGGFLEAAPLTAFVTMSLIGAEARECPVVERALGFLTRNRREDGSWPIDTNLATWGTTLAVKALTADGGALEPAIGEPIAAWLRGQQYTEQHAYTLAAPGGWAWTDLTGGVPDADDTPGALLALRALPADPTDPEAARAGVRWLLDLQNGDGGMPTFCRGWTNLPFDRSGSDLTAHALAAWAAWADELPPLRGRIERAQARAVAYLAGQQRGGGSWLPLWFGNQHTPDRSNPSYGTACVLLGLAPLAGRADAAPLLRRGLSWLASAATASGGYGGAPEAPPTLEETGLALAALVACDEAGLGNEASRRAAARAAAWISETVERAAGAPLPSAPIGLYFAQLWYDERLYPLVYALRGLGAWLGQQRSAGA